MLLAQTNEKLSEMKLYGMLKSVEERLARGDQQGLSFTEFLGLIVDDEWMYRENKKFTLRTKNARFKDQSACIENIEYKASRGLKKTQILELAQNRFIKSSQNILITGSSGAGKSYLAQALGNHAVKSGFTVQYIRIPKLMYAMKQSKIDGSYSKLLKRLSKDKLLILDDFGLGVLAEIEKQDLVELIEERYGVSSTIVTSQLPIGTWHEYLGGGRLAEALLDRLLHNAHRLEINATESMRKSKSNLTQGGHSEI